MACYMCCKNDKEKELYTPNHLELYEVDSEYESTAKSQTRGGEAGSRIPHSSYAARDRTETATEYEEWDYTKRSVQLSYQREENYLNPSFEPVGGDVLAEDDHDHSYVDHRVVTL